MSFFFAKQAEPVKRVARQNTATLNRIGCPACPLNKVDCVTPKMGPTLAATTEVLFLAEAPGKDEDENTGAPLTGPSGRLLRECIPKIERGCSFDNVINCRPPENRTPVSKEVECCRPRRNKVIGEAKPKLIIGLGAVPLNFILGSTDIRNLRGRMFAVKVGGHECYFMPTYHPSFILRTAYNKDRPLQSRFGHCFKRDIENAFKAIKDLGSVHVETEVSIREGVEISDGSDPSRILSVLEAARNAPIKCIDIETSCLRPYTSGAKILTVAISFGDVNFSFPFPLKVGLSYNSYSQSQKICAVLRDLLTDDTIKVAHNAPFEMEWLASYFGKGVIKHDVWECTMMQAHFLDERKGGNRDDDNTGANRYLGLGFLCRMHFGVDCKSLFRLNKKDMASSDLTELLTYNAVDTKYTLRLYHKQMRLLKQRGLEQAYRDAAPRQAAVALMQYQGVLVDQTEVLFNQTALDLVIHSLESNINTIDVVQKYRADHGGQFNPLSGPDTLAIFKDYLKRDEVLIKPKETGGSKPNIGRYSVDKNVLERINHPLANLIVRLRHDTKLKSTYVDGLRKDTDKLVYPDGKLHTSFHTTGTETGRLSSSNPNMQNFPKRVDARVRRQIIAPHGYLMVAVDYKQLEGSTTAMCSKDEYYVNALKENYDTHMVWAERLKALVPSSTQKVDGKFRSMVKNKLVFPAFFGATNESITAYLSAGCNQAIPHSKVEELMDEFWDTFQGVKKWQDRLMKRYYETGYVATLSGRRRHYPLSRNEAINHPVQGTAAELVCDAMVRLSRIATTRGDWNVHPILNIHDDLTFILPSVASELDSCLEIIIREMLTFKFPWVNVPIAIEVSVGKNWCDLEKLGEFWSHELN